MENLSYQNMCLMVTLCISRFLFLDLQQQLREPELQLLFLTELLVYWNVQTAFYCKVFLLPKHFWN